MIRIIDIQKNIVYMEVTADASPDEMTESYEQIEELMDEYDTVNVYEKVSLTGTDFLSMHPKASQDLQRGENVNLGKVAIVGGGVWMKFLTFVWKAVSPIISLSPNELRYFEASQSSEADEWVTQTQ